jgi:tRNA1(Val) A37 N6-methylase TrmN6
MTAGVPDADAPTQDAFHRGRFVLVQPRKGHRAGLDAMLLAAAVPGGFAGRLADLGAGAGAAGLAVAARCPEAQILLVEREPEMVAHARLTLAHPANASLAGQIGILAADVTLTGKARREAGLGDNAFDLVVMNPPFNEGSDRGSPDALRRSAHVMEIGLLESWLRTAGAIAKPRGMMALIARPQSLDEILAACRGRFGGLTLLPVLPRAGDPAIRLIVRGVRGSRAALALHPPLILHDGDGAGFSERAQAAINGHATLFGD